MKRRKPLRRRRSPMRRATALTRAAIARHRKPRTPEEINGRGLVAVRSGGICETDGVSSASDFHHRKRRSQGGTWCPSNGLHVCRHCHDVITRTMSPPHPGGWVVASYQDPAEVPVLHGRHGWVLLRPDGGIAPAPHRKAA